MKTPIAQYLVYDIKNKQPKQGKNKKNSTMSRKKTVSHFLRS